MSDFKRLNFRFNQFKIPHFSSQIDSVWVMSAIVGNMFVHDFVATSLDQNTKKQPALEVSEDFPYGKSTSNKLCTVLPTVVLLFQSVFVIIRICFKSIGQFCIPQFFKSARVFSANGFFIFFRSTDKLKNPPQIFHISVRFQSVLY